MKKFQVLGNPISHSLSPFIHEYFAKNNNINITYEKVLVDINDDDFEIYVRDFFYKENNIGLNITLPFKERAFKLAIQHSKYAFYAKASNTLYLKDGEIFADNTDGQGLVTDITKYHHISLQNKNILLLGAGGASKGCLYNLFQEQPNHICIANRSIDKAANLVQNAKNEYIKNNIANNIKNNLITYCTLDNLIEFNDTDIKFDIIINATSIGMNSSLNNNQSSVSANANDKGDNFFIHESYINQASIFAYDMIYNKYSPFLEWAKNNNIKCVNGIGMLIQQAACAFKIWHNIAEINKLNDIYTELFC